MGKKTTEMLSVDSPDSMQGLPSCNGTQLALFPWLRLLNTSTDGFESDKAYFLVVRNSSYVSASVFFMSTARNSSVVSCVIWQFVHGCEIILSYDHHGTSSAVSPL